MTAKTVRFLIKVEDANCFAESTYPQLQTAHWNSPCSMWLAPEDECSWNSQLCGAAWAVIEREVSEWAALDRRMLHLGVWYLAPVWGQFIQSPTTVCVINWNVHKWLVLFSPTSSFLVWFEWAALWTFDFFSLSLSSNQPRWSPCNPKRGIIRALLPAPLISLERLTGITTGRLRAFDVVGGVLLQW